MIRDKKDEYARAKIEEFLIGYLPVILEEVAIYECGRTEDEFREAIEKSIKEGKIGEIINKILNGRFKNGD